VIPRLNQLVLIDSVVQIRVITPAGLILSLSIGHVPDTVRKALDGGDDEQAACTMCT